MSRREYAVHDAEGNSRGLAPWGNTEAEHIASCVQEAERLTEMWATAKSRMPRDVFTVVTREVTEWEPVE